MKFSQEEYVIVDRVGTTHYLSTYHHSGLRPAPYLKKKRRGVARVVVLISAVVLAGALAGVSLYRGDPTSYQYQDKGFQFHLTSAETTQITAVIVSADTTAPVTAQVQALRRTGRLWADALSWLKKDTQAYPVTRVTGLSSKNGPIDLSKLATDTTLALEGQSVCYRTAGYSLVATQTGDTLVLQTASVESTTLPARLFRGIDAKPLAVKLSAALEAKLLAGATEIAATPVRKSSEYDLLAQRVATAAKPYAAVMSTALAQGIQGIQDTLKAKKDDLRDSEGVLLDVPVISQRPEFKAGCEAASTAMLITYGGHAVSTADIIDVMPYSSDPARGYVGNPRTWDGWTIYPSAMKGVVQRYLGSGVDLTDCGMDTLHAYLLAGKPVVCWFGAGALPGISPHCVCVTGYRQGTIYYNDPYLTVKNKAVSESTFRFWWGEMDNRALSY